MSAVNLVGRNADEPALLAREGGSEREQKGKAGPNRIHLALSDNALSALELIQERLEASTTSEAIRRSILLALKITDSVAEGGRVVIEKKDGTQEVILLA